MSKANSLKNSETFDNFLNRMRLSIRNLANQSKNFIIVEGNFDILLYKKFYKKDQYEIHEVAGGCLNLEKAVKVLFDESKQFIGIRDADFYHLEGLKPECKAVFLTDTHDAETMCLASSAVIEAILREGKLEVKTNDFLNSLFEQVKLISCIKWHNYKHSLGFNFNGMRVQEINEENFLDILLSRSPQASKNINKNKISTEIKKIFQENLYDLFQLCNGHDIVSIIHQKTNLSKTQIEIILRTAYQEEDFQKTKLFQNIQNWLKKAENEDYFDTNTNLKPFHV